MKKRISILVPISVALILLTLLLGVVSAAGSRKNSPQAVDANGIKSDDFNQAALASFWAHIPGVTGDPAPVMNGSAVEITVPAGTSHNIWTDGNKASRIMQPAPDSNFEVEVKFNSGVNNTFEMQGILVEQDIDDFLRFEFYGTGGQTYGYAAEFRSGVVVWNQTEQDLEPGNTAPLYMRIKRQGTDWTYDYSLNGTNWSTIITRTVTPKLTVSNIGIYAGNHHPTPTLSPGHTTVADYFHNTANPGPFNLNITSNGNGNVVRNPDLAQYSASQLVTLMPMPDPGWNFGGWSGPNAGDLNDLGGGTWSLTMDDNKAVTATFVTSYTLNVNTNGNGTVTIDPPGPEYDPGTIVMLTATADPDWFFVNWSGDISTTDNPTTITMDSNKTVTANFGTESFQVFIPIALKP